MKFPCSTALKMKASMNLLENTLQATRPRPIQLTTPQPLVKKTIHNWLKTLIPNPVPPLNWLTDFKIQVTNLKANILPRVIWMIPRAMATSQLAQTSTTRYSIRLKTSLAHLLTLRPLKTLRAKKRALQMTKSTSFGRKPTIPKN